MPVKKNNKNVNTDNILTALDLLYGRDDKYFSDIYFSSISLKNKLTQIGAVTTNDLAYLVYNEPKNEFQENLIREFTNAQNLYLTANGFKWTNLSSGKGKKKYNNGRRNDKISSYYNVVIDIDCHDRAYGNSLVDINCKGYKLGMKRDEKFDDYIDDFMNLIDVVTDNEDFIEPTMYVKTGRGLQIWYSIVPVPASQKYAYDYFRESILNFYRQIFSKKQYEHFTWLFKLDEGATIKDAGLFRVPGTYNTKAKYRSEFIIVNKDKTNVINYYFDNKTLQIKEKTYIKNFVSDYFKPYLCRKQLFENIILKRNKEEYNLGYRNNLLFAAYNNERSAGVEHDDAMSFIKYLNNLFTRPLCIKEVEGSLKTSHRKGKYNLSNKTIIKYLCMSSEECDLFNFHEFISRTEKSKKRKQKKEERNELIIKLYKKGLSQIEIGEECNCSQPTVHRVIKNYEENLMEKIECKEVNEDSVSVAEEKKIVALDNINKFTNSIKGALCNAVMCFVESLCHEDYTGIPDTG